MPPEEYKPFRYDLVFRHTTIACPAPVIAGLGEIIVNMPPDLEVVGHDYNIALNAIERQIRLDVNLFSDKFRVVIDLEMQNTSTAKDRSSQYQLIRRLFKYAYNQLEYTEREAGGETATSIVVMFANFDPFHAGKEMYRLGASGDLPADIAAELQVGLESSFLQIILINAPKMKESKDHPPLASLCTLMVENKATDAGTAELLKVSRLVQANTTYKEDEKMIESLIEQGRQEGREEATGSIGEKLTRLAALVSGREDAAEILTDAVAHLDQVDQIIIRYQ